MSDPSHLNVVQPLTNASITIEDELRELALTCLASYEAPSGPVGFGFILNNRPSDVAIDVWVKREPDLTAFLGFDAPDDWDVFAIAQSSATLTTGVDQIATPFVHLQHRAGPSLSRFDNGLELTPHEAVGQLPDLGRRVLGLATAPCETSPAVFFTQLWLEACLLHALDHDVLFWEQLRDCFAFSSLLQQATAAHPDMYAGADDAFHAVVPLLANAYPWPILRRMFAQDSPFVPFRTKHAEWMDDAMFARALMAQRMPLPVLLSELEAAVPHDVAMQVYEALDAWGVLPDVAGGALLG